MNPEVIQALKLRATLQVGVPVYTYWRSLIRIEDAMKQQVFGSGIAIYGNEILELHGMNIAVHCGDGKLATREFGLYHPVIQDESQPIQYLDTWTNLDGEDVSILPVDNIVNLDFSTELKGCFSQVNERTWQVLVKMNYPNPLQPGTYSKSSHGPTYKGVECFTFRMDTEPLDSMGAWFPVISWSRTSPWLPWMGHGDRKGHLTYTAPIVYKTFSLDDVPKEFVEAMKARKPEALEPLTKWTKTRQTSWTQYAVAYPNGDV